jgi:hypothetical protein
MVSMTSRNPLLIFILISLSGLVGIKDLPYTSEIETPGV